MKPFRTFTALLGLALLFVAFSSIANADEWDKTTKVTFKESVQVPGKVLPPGTYVFKLLDSPSNRHIVQIYNQDHTQLITTVLAVPNQRLEPAGKTILTYDERPADQPMALAAWFYPGDNFGQQFVYPKSEAEQLSRLNKQEVPSSGSEEANPQLKERSNEVAENANPTPKPETPAPQASSQPTAPPSTAAPAPPASQSNKNVVAKRTELPHTSSNLPLMAFSGLALMIMAAFLRFVVRA